MSDAMPPPRVGDPGRLAVVSLLRDVQQVDDLGFEDEVEAMLLLGEREHAAELDDVLAFGQWGQQHPVSIGDGQLAAAFQTDDLTAV